jgi:hypothetical protein
MTQTTGSPADDGGPMVAVRSFMDGFNRDDADGVQAACTDETAIIDDFPPHEWAGAGSAATWYRDMARMATDYGMSDWSVVLDDPRHDVVTDGRAYVVVPVIARWQQEGSQVDRPGSFTAALREQTDGWRISAFAWTWS